MEEILGVLDGQGNVFKKLVCRRRGELVARLFAEHYTDGVPARMLQIR